MRRIVSLLLIATSALVGSCGNDHETPPCYSDQEFFERKVWGEVLGVSCIGCHTLSGPAAEAQAKFVLQPPAYPNFLEVNYANAVAMSQVEIAGVAALLVKPTNPQTPDGAMHSATTHGGGVQIELDSDQYEILQEFIARTQSPTASCPDDGGAGPFDDLALLDGPQTLRKAMLELAGRLPTTAERQQLVDAGADGLDAALDQALDQVMTEPAFYDRITELYNDVFLTDRYLSFTGRATGLLNTTDWPNAANAVFNTLPQLDRERTNLAVAREPLALINHVIRQGRPFTEILTADYTVVNPYSAALYNVPASFADPTNEADWQEVRLSVTRMGVPTPWPHTGVLSSPMWLNRFPTTVTNRNRHRASMIYKEFLATDILAIADRPIDADNAGNLVPNPTREAPACRICHAQIDPIAGTFQKFNANDQEQFDPNLMWFQEMYPPGFEGKQLATNEYVRALPWLGAQLAADPRFAVSVTRQVFEGLTGQAPVSYPLVSDRVHFEGRRQAFLTQDLVLAEIAAEFVASNYDFRTVVKAVIRSPYFRATNAHGALDAEAAARLDAFGTAKFLTPERLSRKVEAITGAPWVRNDRRDYLTTDYRVPFGGIDSDLIVERLTAPNGTMSGVAWRLSTEVACQTTAWDFTRPAGERNLFPQVAITDVPEVNGTPSQDGESKIRIGLVHLHERVLGETLSPTDPEIDRSYQLWLETWREGTAGLTGGSLSVNLLNNCRGRLDPRTGATLPTEQQIDRDPDYTIRSWMAVLTYLLADFRFLHS